jgi:signal transduction histidine kinase
MKLRPSLLDDLGILAALEWYAHDFQSRTGVQCKFTARVQDLDLDRERATTVFRIFQESLTNVARHANATRVTAKLNVVGGDVVLEVKDNGRGITERELANPRSFGLLGMRERAYLAGGDVQFKGHHGKGTTISVRIPVGPGTEG